MTLRTSKARTAQSRVSAHFLSSSAFEDDHGDCQDEALSPAGDAEVSSARNVRKTVERSLAQVYRSKAT